MMPSRLPGLPSLFSSFQLVPPRTPSRRPALASSMALPATFRASPRFIGVLQIWFQWASGGTANWCSSMSAKAASRGTPAATAASTSSSNRSERRFRNSMEKM